MEDDLALDLVDLKSVMDSSGVSQQLSLFRYDIFARFVDIFNRIDSECRKLIIELMKNYLVIKDYNKFIHLICERIEDKFAGERVIIVPIFENLVVKSGHSVSYDCRSYLFREKFSSIDFPDGETALKVNLRGNSIIIIVDDFVGTGNQVNEFIERNKLSRENTHLMSIVVQEEAVKTLDLSVSTIFSPNPYRQRAISDSYSIGNLSVAEAKKIYDRLENELDVSIFYSYGFMSSEAIVTMKRTPDNTLPIFWCEFGKDGTSWPAPFYRS